MRTIRYLLTLVLASVSMAAAAAETGPRSFPMVWDPHERLPVVKLTDIQRVRFLVTLDYPPFSFLDSGGKLAGFHVDLAQSLCRELDILDACQIQALPWDELAGALRSGQAEAVLSGLPAGADLSDIVLTRPYFPLPARFVTRRKAPLEEPLTRSLAGHRTGVMAGSRHEAMLRAWFPEAQVVTYSREDWMLSDVKEGKTDAAFSDGMRLSFWLGGKEADACCMFSGGAYYAPALLGPGHRIAVTAKIARLAPALDQALKQLAIKGVMEELYLRYFPVGFF
ncbi:transporter substrate-binding domain-containing protein [Zhengella mangrovi]|nr:transporter substrate-binding domain-containing protein [Zhengella mangrovi]